MFDVKNDPRVIAARELRVRYDDALTSKAQKARALAIELEFDDAETISAPKLFRMLQHRGYTYNIYTERWTPGDRR